LNLCLPHNKKHMGIFIQQSEALFLICFKAVHLRPKPGNTQAQQKNTLKLFTNAKNMILLTSVVDPVPLVRGADPAPDPSIIIENNKKDLDSYCFVTSLKLFIFEK
jgi:hypothetical protein